MHNLDLAPTSGAALGGSTWLDGVHQQMDRWLTHPRLHHWALYNPLSRWLLRRRTTQIFDLMSGFVYSQVLLSCVRLNLFSIVQQAQIGRAHV